MLKGVILAQFITCENTYYTKFFIYPKKYVKNR